MSTTDEQRKTDEEQIPDPENPAKPDSLREIDKRSWKYVVKKTLREFSDDQCTDIAAGLTYFAVLALFPALIAVFSILGVIGQGESAAEAITGIIQSFAPDAADALDGPLSDIANSPGAGFALISGIVLAIWAASGYVGAFSRAMNRIYEIEEGRPFWKLKPAQLLVTVIGIVMIAIAAIILVVSGPVADAVGSALGLGDVATTVWSILKWPVLAFIVVLMVAILYYATPNAKQPKFRWISLGSLLAILVLTLATVAFGIYVTNFSNYDRTYGSLAGIVIFLLWLYIANLALLFGAEFDAELERGRQLQGGLPAEETLQLPPRDDRKIKKAEKKDKEELEEARSIREEHSDDDENASRSGSRDSSRDDANRPTS
ncbi:YihY/virulence factor BrkB family protein [Microbacterium sp. 4R-513]|uniref:YihY/virulence factor BrkB family protein n=1 Tax=Microbacterium sp. 4R-513 TaxID=2567934 RepID=UPI0013E1D5D7|nr:YihY/virulence factor BrkB family protein [Microbacterium sp. 4R-513]QIG38258.1 YihY/virulence factor BrkB family protein [Microbacterium sp. 4R-513]